MSEQFLAALASAFTPTILATNALGMVLGILFGAIPGLTGNLGIILLLPFTMTMEPAQALVFLVSIFCGGEFGGSISAILLGTPGTNSATCTMMEGYPLAKQGKARKALLMALTASTFGGLFSTIILAVAAPTIAMFTINFGPPESFAMAMFGLSIIASLSAKSLAKGLIAGGIGMLLSLVGLDITSGIERYTFGNINLLSGIALVPLLTGAFAIPSIIEKVSECFQEKQGYTAPKPIKMHADDTLTLAEVLERKWIMLRGAVVGTIIGAIPGAGTAIAAFISYDDAKRSSKHPELFGTGTLDGIAAPEAANNAVTSGSLIPLFTLGLPGCPAGATLIGAFMLQGMSPGPLLFKEHGEIMYTIIISVFVANILMYAEGRVLSKYFAKITQIPKIIMVPALVVICAAGAYSVNNATFDVAVFILFGIVAYILGLFDIPMVPMVLGFVLGPIAEFNFRRSLVMSQNSLTIFFTRPICLLILALTVLMLVYSSKRNKKQKRQEI